MNFVKKINDKKVTWVLCHSLPPTRPLEILTSMQTSMLPNDMKHSVLAAAEFLACSNIKSRNADWTLHAIFVRSMIHQHSWRLATMHCKVCSYMIIYIDWLAQLSHPLSLGKWSDAVDDDQKQLTGSRSLTDSSSSTRFIQSGPHKVSYT